MLRFRKLVIPLLVCLLLLFVFSLAPAGSGVVAQDQIQAVMVGGTVVYNIYATDGYIKLPDGHLLYNYGFIGGRQGQPIHYLDGSIAQNGELIGPYTPPAPTAGPITELEAPLAGNAQFPAPIIHATVGDVVEIRLKNLGVVAQPVAPNDPHSIHLHGLDVDAANDGVPETSLGAVPANLEGAPGAGNVIVYMFSPEHAGTYMYHCHQEAQIHVQMGMFGALVVYNPGDPAAATGPGQGLGGQLYGVPYDKDYVLLLSEFDVGGHRAEETDGAEPPDYNWAYYQPEYWSINGLSFPQTIHAGFVEDPTWDEWIMAHPGYDPLITGSVSGGSGAWGTPGEKVLIRVINMGFQTHPMHMHGYHGKVIGSDQRAWDWAWAPKSKTNKSGFRPFGEGLEKNTLLIGSGETYDWLVDFGQQSFNSVYPAGTQSRYYDGSAGCDADLLAVPMELPALNTPVSNTFENCPVIPLDGDPEAGPYIGGPVVAGLFDDMTPGATSQFFPFHNHDDYKATNDGEYPGGMFTMIVPTP
jgi:FtsP/CotA-like multicopper oxidase with cupredoxin domain